MNRVTGLFALAAILIVVAPASAGVIRATAKRIVKPTIACVVHGVKAAVRQLAKIY